MTPLAIEGSVSSGQDIVAGTTLTFSHTTNAASTLLVVPVPHYHATARTVTGVTFNTTSALTFHDRYVPGTYPERVEFWYLTTPPLSTTGDIVVTMSGTTDAIFACAINFSGNDATPLGPMAGTFGAASAWSLNVPSAAGDICLDAAIVYPDEAAQLWTVGGGQTERWHFTNEYDQDSSFGSTEPAVGGATTAMSWARASSSDYFAAGVAVRQFVPESGAMMAPIFRL